MDVVRAFVAVELPIDIRRELDRAQRVLQATAAGAARSVRWVDCDGIHLTLKFLGDTPLSGIDAIRSALQQASTASRPFTLQLGEAGCFPNPRQPRVLWIGVSGEVDAARTLQGAVERTVSPLGFPSESRSFSPHLTLGRVRDEAAPDARQKLGAAVLSLHPAPLSFAVSSVSLMRSDLRREGAVYSELAVVALGAQAAQG